MMGRAGRDPQQQIDIKEAFDAAKAIGSNPHLHPVTVRILPPKDDSSPYVQSKAHTLPAPKEMYCLQLGNGAVMLDKEAAKKIMLVNTKNLEAVNSGDYCLLGKIEKELDEKKDTP